MRSTAQPDFPSSRGPSRIREWICRYGAAEISGTVMAYAAAALALSFGGNETVAAYAGALGENAGFYGAIIFRELRSVPGKRRSRRRKNTLVIARNLLLEFGAAEVLDTLLLRPAAMGLGMRLFGQEAGIAAGKLLADITFYVPTIVSYELRKRFSSR